MNAARSAIVCKWHEDMVAELLELGTAVHLVLDRFDTLNTLIPPHVLSRCASVHRVGSFDSIEEMSAVAVDLAMGAQPVDAVLGHSETSQFGAGYLNLAVGVLAGQEGAAIRLAAHRDKRMMKHLVGRHGVSMARYVSVPDPSDPQATQTVLAAGLDFPMIVKPAAGFGGISATRVDDQAGLRAALAGYTVNPLLKSRAVIVEEFVSGIELAVDSIWSGGRPLSMVVARYHQPRLTHATPTAETMDGSRVLHEGDYPQIYQQMRAMHAAVNPALGITDCATHMEAFLLDSGELTFSEIATRGGGAWIPDMLSVHLGYPMWRAVARGVVTGHLEPPAAGRDRYVGAVSLHPSEPGVVTSMPSSEQVAALEGVVTWRHVKKPGDRARVNHPSEYFLHIVLTGSSEDELVRRCRNAVDTARVSTAPMGAPVEAAAHGAR